MKVTVFSNKDRQAELPSDDGYQLVMVFLRYQGIKIEHKEASAMDIGLLSNGASVLFCVQFNEMYFHNPMQLIYHFQSKGLLRLG